MEIEIDTSDLEASIDSLTAVLSPDGMSRALKDMGTIMVDTATDLVPVDTGHLKGNIKSRISSNDAGDCSLTVGVHDDDMASQNLEYAVYLEYGTGIYAENGKGRKTPWSWKGTGVKWGAGQDKSAWHTTQGMQAHPFLRPAFDRNADECFDILAEYVEEAMRGDA